MASDVWDLGFNLFDVELGTHITRHVDAVFEYGVLGKIYDTHMSWTPNEHAGRTLDIKSGDMKGTYTIIDNGANYLDVAGDFSAVSNNGYGILTVPAGGSSDGATLASTIFPTTSPEQAVIELVQKLGVNFYNYVSLASTIFPTTSPEQAVITLLQHRDVDFFWYYWLGSMPTVPAPHQYFCVGLRRIST